MSVVKVDEQGGPEWTAVGPTLRARAGLAGSSLGEHGATALFVRANIGAAVVRAEKRRFSGAIRPRPALRLEAGPRNRGRETRWTAATNGGGLPVGVA